MNDCNLWQSRTANSGEGGESDSQGHDIIIYKRQFFSKNHKCIQRKGKYSPIQKNNEAYFGLTK